MKESNVNSNRKKLPSSNEATPEKEEPQPMEVEYNQNNKTSSKALKFNELPEVIDFYITELYPYANNQLFITGKMTNGQTLNVVATNPVRELHFALKREYSDTDALSEGFKNRAEK